MGRSTRQQPDSAPVASDRQAGARLHSMSATITKQPHHAAVCDWDDDHLVDTVLLVRAFERRRKRDGAPFLRLTLADRSATVSAVLWDPRGDEAEIATPGSPVHLRGHVANHPRYGRQLTITTLDRPAPTEV